jgi:S1-C subfamily serine protease
MHPGNSGGPVVDAAGKLVGVAVSGIKGTAIHFAIPADRIHIFHNGRVQSATRDQPYKDGGPRRRLTRWS